jgi:hypothetical protein
MDFRQRAALSLLRLRMAIRWPSLALHSSGSLPRSLSAPTPERHMMTFEQILAAIGAVLSHPETVVPAAVAPQAEALAAVAAQGISAVEGGALGLAEPLANAEVTSVMNHNHLGSFAPVVVGILDNIASGYLASRGVTVPPVTAPTTAPAQIPGS